MTEEPLRIKVKLVAMTIRNTTNKAHPATGFYPCARDCAGVVVQRDT